MIMCVCVRERERGPGRPHESGTSGRLLVIQRDGGGGVTGRQADRLTNKQKDSVCVCERERARERGPGRPHESGTSGRLLVILRDGGWGGTFRQTGRQDLTNKQKDSVCV